MSRVTGEAFAVVAIHPSGLRTVVQHLVCDTAAEAERKAIKRDRHPNAIAMGITHEVAAVSRSARNQRFEETSP